MNKVGAEIVDILERAGAQYLSQIEPDLYQAYLLNVGATQALRRYDGTETYWDRVQAILDAFFSSSERAEICTELIAHRALWDLPECRGFLIRAAGRAPTAKPARRSADELGHEAERVANCRAPARLRT